MATKGRDLFVCSFPMYSIAPLGHGEFYVAGGGGLAKTGVPNALEIRSLSQNGDKYVSDCILRYDMATELIMNSQPNPRDPCTVAASIGHSCHLMKVHRTRKTRVEKMSSVRSDFSEKDAYQKVVCFSHDGSRVVTGGAEGVVKVWKYPGLRELHKLRGHKDEIEDLCAFPSKLKIVSVCRGGEALVWDLEKGQQLKQFTWNPDQKSKYRFRACCFAPVSDGKDPDFYSINIPVKWVQRAKRYCYLLKWNSSTWKVVAQQRPLKGLLCAITIDSCGNRVAIGDTEGSVAIYATNGLKLLTKVSNVHTVFVTGLAFVSASDAIKPDNKKQQKQNKSKSSEQIQPKKEVLLSISADKTCCVTTVTTGRGCCNQTVILFVLLPLFFVHIAMCMWLFVL